ncbi:MAG: hypothetical protein ACKO6M_07625 [Bacteroidota bacterium]
MKRQPKHLPKNLTLLDLTLEDLEVLLGDEQGLISLIVGKNRSTDNHQNALVVYTDDDLCLYFVDGGGRRSKGPQSDTHFHFLDTTELPDWQGILRYLHWEQHGLNSLGDE